MTVLSSSTEVNMEEKSTIVFDFSLFRDYRSAHAVMRAALGSTDYIGNNLDALHDVLTSLRKETAIRVVQIGRFPSVLLLKRACARKVREKTEGQPGIGSRGPTKTEIG